MTAVVALATLAGGFSLGGIATNCSGQGWECFGQAILFFFVVFPLIVAGSSLGLASLVPFGTFRRILVGTGAALIGGIAVAAALVGALLGIAIVVGPIGPAARVLILGPLAGATLFFLLGYRIAR